ncbi:hypothetical protein ACJMK2_039793 [Sinanodonta woodiana]|uniref:Uncharacterized protein n=1 Tax=Sinanodonta woodiana TaxID=1069815 RepID=A0ABD3WD35_SINWO
MGVENHDVAQYILSHPRRLNRRSFLTGKRQLVVSLEVKGFLYPDSEKRVLCSHYVYRNIINDTIPLIILRLQRICNENQVIANVYFIMEWIQMHCSLPEPSDVDYIVVPSIELLNEEQLHSLNDKSGWSPR